MILTRSRLLLVTVFALAGCESRGVVSEPDSTGDSASPTVYGQLLQPGTSVVRLSEIVADPASYDGQVVLTEGEVQRVCQKRGCWLELADSNGARAFVPMAGHSFTVPMESVGEQAQVEGTVHVRERSEAERKHLESDGAGSNIPAVSIEANAVLIR